MLPVNDSGKAEKGCIYLALPLFIISEITIMQKGNPKPHHRLTFDDVTRDFRDGLLTPRGALFYAISATRKQGEVIRLNPEALAKRIGIKRTAYYDALAALTVRKRLQFEATEMVVSVPVDDDGTPIYFLDSQSAKPDSQSLEPAPSNGSSAPLSLQSIQSTQSIEERESAGEEEESDRAFRDWLINRANSLPQKPALMEQWIEKEMDKKANKREFAQYQASMAVIPIPAILPIENIASQDYWSEVQRRNGNG